MYDAVHKTKTYKPPYEFKPTYDSAFKKNAENQWYNKITHGSFKEDDRFKSMVKNQAKAQSWYNNTYGEKNGKKEYQNLHNRLINTPYNKIKEEEKQFINYKASDFKVPEIEPINYNPAKSAGTLRQYSNTSNRNEINEFSTPHKMENPQYNYDFGSIMNWGIEESRKGEFKPRKDKRHGSENRQPSGSRERNVGHPEGEEHSRVPKGNNNRRNGVYRNEQDFWDDVAKGIVTVIAVAAGVCWFCYTGDPTKIYTF